MSNDFRALIEQMMEYEESQFDAIRTALLATTDYKIAREHIDKFNIIITTCKAFLDTPAIKACDRSLYGVVIRNHDTGVILNSARLEFLNQMCQHSDCIYKMARTILRANL